MCVCVCARVGCSCSICTTEQSTIYCSCAERLGESMCASGHPITHTWLVPGVKPPDVKTNTQCVCISRCLHVLLNAHNACHETVFHDWHTTSCVEASNATWIVNKMSPGSRCLHMPACGTSLARLYLLPITLNVCMPLRCQLTPAACNKRSTWTRLMPPAFAYQQLNQTNNTFHHHHHSRTHMH